MEEKRIDQYTAKGFEGAENDEQYLLVVKNLKKWFPIKSSFFKVNQNCIVSSLAECTLPRSFFCHFTL